MEGTVGDATWSFIFQHIVLKINAGFVWTVTMNFYIAEYILL